MALALNTVLFNIQMVGVALAVGVSPNAFLPSAPIPQRRYCSDHLLNYNQFLALKLTTILNSIQTI